MTWGKDTHGADTSQISSLLQNVVKIVPIAGIGGDGFLALREDGLAIKWGNGWYDTIEGATEIYGSRFYSAYDTNYQGSHYILKANDELHVSNYNADFDEAKVWKFEEPIDRIIYADQYGLAVTNTGNVYSTSNGLQINGEWVDNQSWNAEDQRPELVLSDVIDIEINDGRSDTFAAFLTSDGKVNVIGGSIYRGGTLDIVESLGARVDVSYYLTDIANIVSSGGSAWFLAEKTGSYAGWGSFGGSGKVYNETQQLISQFSNIKKYLLMNTAMKMQLYPRMEIYSFLEDQTLGFKRVRLI